MWLQLGLLARFCKRSIIPCGRVFDEPLQANSAFAFKGVEYGAASLSWHMKPCLAYSGTSVWGRVSTRNIPNLAGVLHVEHLPIFFKT